MSGKAKKRLPKVYYMAPNGIKIELKGFQSTEVMLIPDKELVGVIVHEPRMNVALTDELNTKGSIDVTFKYGDFKYDEVNK